MGLSDTILEHVLRCSEYHQGKIAKIYWVVAKIGPDGLGREIWTESGPDLSKRLYNSGLYIIATAK